MPPPPFAKGWGTTKLITQKDSDNYGSPLVSGVTYKYYLAAANNYLAAAT